MRWDKLLTRVFLTLTFGTVLLAERVKIAPPVKVPSNLVEGPEYDSSSACPLCEKEQYVGTDERDFFFSKKRRPALLENGVQYTDEDELYVGGKPSYVPTNEDIVEDSVSLEIK